MKAPCVCSQNAVDSCIFGKCGRNRGRSSRLKRLADLMGAIENNASVKFDTLLARLGPLQCFLDETRDSLTPDQVDSSFLLLHPLHKACFHQNIEFIEKLLRNGIDPCRTDDIGRSAVEVLLKSWNVQLSNIGSAFREHCHLPIRIMELTIEEEIKQHAMRCFSLLMNAYNDYSVKFGFKELTAMHLGLESKLYPVVEYLVSQGADVNSRNSDGNTPLILATRYFNILSVNILLEHGADVNARNNDGLTALHYSCRCLRRSTHAIDLLVKHGADVNIQTKLGFTALHYAALCEEYAKVHKLLKYDADPDFTTAKGQTVLYFLLDSHTGTTEAAAIAYNHCLCEMKQIRIRDMHGRLPLSLRNGDYPGLAERLDDFTSKPRPLKQLALVHVKRLLGKKRQNLWDLKKLIIPRMMKDIIMDSERYTDVLIQLGIRLRRAVPEVSDSGEFILNVTKYEDVRYGLWLAM